MDNNNININGSNHFVVRNANDVADNMGLTFRDLIEIILQKWYWFLISLVFCFCFGVFLLRSEVPLFKRTSIVLVKQENKNINSPIQFTSLGGISTNQGVENELYMFRTRMVLTPVVKKLGLDVIYSMEGILRDYPLYNEGPFKVSFLNDYTYNISLTLELKDSSSYRILNVNTYRNGQEIDDDTKIDCQFGKTVELYGERFVVNPVPEYLEPYAEKTITVSRISVPSAAAIAQSNLSTALVGENTTLISITCVDSHPRRAVDILNTLIDEYNLSILEDKNYVTTSTAAFLDDRIRVISTELGQVEDELTSFKQKNNIVDMSSSATQYINESFKVRSEALKLETDKIVAESILSYLKDESKTNTVIPNVAVTDENGVLGQIKIYNELIMQRNRLLSNSGENNVVVRNMDINLDAMRQTISGSVDNYIRSLDLRIEKARQTEEDILGSIRRVPQNERIALNIMRQQEIKETLYTYLLQKREENALQMAVTETNIRVAEEPYGPNLPILPKSINYYFISIVLGIILPLIYLVIAVFMNTKVRSRRDIEGVLSLPIIGEIPQADRKQGASALEVSEKSNNILSESFRMLRANLNFMASDAQVLMFISTMPDEGKTFVSRNLARTLSFSGKRVILVDTDLRKRTQSIELNADGDNGLTYYLSGHITDLKSIIKHNVFGNIDLLPAGAIPPNPSELLMSDRFDAVIAELRKMYDYIILDNVPAQAVADAAVVNRVADLTFYVIRVDYLDRRNLVDIERLKRENKFRNMSVILNGCITDKKRYGYGYGYGYGSYGYGYGYGSKKESRFGIRRRLKKIFKL